MFLTLLLLGLGVSYYCLSRRPIPVVRRLPVSVGSGSEITKLSSSTYGNIPPFEGLKIPRAHTIVGAVPSASSSDDNPLISDTLPSDYPSESQSEVEIDTRSLPASSQGSYDNRAYVQEGSSIYSEHYGHTQEFQAANAIAQQTFAPRLPIAVKEPSPQFDVQVRVKRPAPQAPLSSFSSDTESISVHERNNLSTIMESHEDRESVMTMDSLPQDVAHSQFTYVPELHPAPMYQPPPITTTSRMYRETETHEETWREDYTDSMPPPPPSLPETQSFVSTERHDMHSISEMVDRSHLYQRQPYETTVPIEEVERLPEPPIVAKKPEITSHLVDDVFLRTITEKTTIEDIEKYKRMVTEYKAKPVVPPTWDVTIRNIPQQDKPQWEDFSDVTSLSDPSVQTEPPRYNVPPPNYIDESGAKLTSPELVGNMKPVETPPEDKSVANWDVLVRIFDHQDETEIIRDDTSSTHSQPMPHVLQRNLSYDDKVKWRDIITTESTLRTMLTEAVVREDFERIRSDTRYETLFEPQTWDILIRILAPPDDVELRQPKRKKKEPWDTRSRRSSLPTLYEYDSDGGSSVRTIPQDVLPTGSANTYQYPPTSRRTSRSSYNAEHVDMRSMSEVMVDFARPDSDNVSDVSSFYPNR